MNIWYKFNRNNIRIIGVSEGQENNSCEEARIKDIIAEKFPELKNAYIHNLDAWRVPAKIDPNQSKTAKSKRKIIYKDANLRFKVDLSIAILQVQRQWWDIVKKF